MRASEEVQNSKPLELAYTFARNGISFIPIPVTGKDSEEKLVQLMMKQLALIEQEAREQ